MAGKLQQFVKKTKDKKAEEAKRLEELRAKVLSLVPRCELNDELPEDAAPEALWKAVCDNFCWSFGPAKGKSIQDTRTQFIRWAMRKLKDPVKTICHIEYMLRKNEWVDLDALDPPQGSNDDPAESSEPAESSAEAAPENEGTTEA